MPRAAQLAAPLNKEATEKGHFHAIKNRKGKAMCHSDKGKQFKPCDLCGRPQEIEAGFRQSSLRGLCLCCSCDSELGGGQYSAAIVQAEYRSMKVGGLFANRPPLAAREMAAIWGSKDERNLAAIQPPTPRPEWVPVGGKPWRLTDPQTGDYVRGSDGAALKFNSPQQAIKTAAKVSRRPRNIPQPPPASPEPPPVRSTWHDRRRRAICAAYV